MHVYYTIKILMSNCNHKVNVLQNFQVVVGPIVQGTKSNDNIVLRQNDDHLPMCTALENIKLL